MKKVLGLGAIAVVVLAACGGGNNSGSSSGGSPQHKGGGVATLTVNTASVSGLGTVLVDARGLTLYHLKSETTSNVQCTGSCLSTWPPLLLSGGGSPTGGVEVTGTLTTFSRPDGGTQVVYNGLPLYTFTGDSAEGQANGQGVGNFFAVTPSMGSSGGGSGGGYGSSPSPSSSYGY